LVNEGCLQGLGTRQILRFTTTIWNIGNQDYFIGVPTAANEQFEWDPCHNHYHYEGYAEYLLYNQAGVPMPEIGFKNGFCVLDLFCPSGFTAKYTCGNMGITAGCRDTYSSALACQWIDITNVPAGEYYLVVRTNWDQAPDQLGRYELRYDNNWAQVCISFGRDANNNIINFTKNINSCPIIEDCVGQPFGDQYADCAGNCPGTVRSADVVSDFLINELDVHQYLDAASRNVIIPVSNCTDLNSDGMISVADAAYLEECIHDQLDLGVNPLMLDECAWDPEVFDNNKSAEIGVASINTTLGYVDIYIRNEDCEISGLEFELSGLAIENVTPLLPIQDWNPHIHFETEGTKVAVVGAAHSLLPVHFTNTPVLRVYYSLLEGQEVCVSAIVDVLDEFVHNILFDYGTCASIAANVEADFTASSENVCAGSAITFSPGETGTPTSWSWSFPGGTPSTSSSQFPVITYNSPGLYSVSLTVSNGTSSDEITVENLITVNNSVTYYQDADGDGFGNPLVTQSGCVAPTGYVSNAADCNDGASAVNPSASEICNNTDDDCDTVVDEGFDMDNDGVTVCEGDCDDNNALVYPGAFELCNGNDEDCDDIIDEGFDQDNDGVTVCGGDCNDTNPNIYPGATEICGNNIDEDCTGGLNNGCPVFIYYPDNDNDGYGTLANSINSYSNTPPIGYVTQSGDCNDNNSSVRPGTQELCITNYDDDCDGFVNEGCIITAVPNDSRSNAMMMPGNSYPGCTNNSANLLNATASEESTSTEPLGAGQDVWYTFVANTNGVRITASSSVNDMVIELQTQEGVTLAIQNAGGIGSGEILNYGLLNPGTTYFVALRNFNTNAAGTFNVCIQHLIASDPDYGLNYSGVCSVFKCDWNGAHIYQVTFVDGEDEYTYSSSSTLMPLTLFQGLQYDHTYQVFINSIFNFPGAPSITVTGGPYTVNIAPHQDIDLRTIDRCPTTRALGAFISADVSLCQFTEYEWEFVQVDENDQPVGLETYYVESNSPTRFMRVSWIPNVQPGNHYRVRIRPIFAYGAGSWGSDYQILCVTTSAGIQVAQTITNQKDQSESAQQFTDNSTGIYPNPCNGKMVNISIEGLETERLIIALYDMIGKKVFEKELTVSSSQIRLDFTNELPNGLYSLEMSFDEERIVEKLLVSH
jgi:PKD repeat protein